MSHLDVDGTLHVDWDEAVDLAVDVQPIALPSHGSTAHTTAFAFGDHTAHEAIRTADGRLAGRFVRRREQVQGLVHVATVRPDAEAPYVKVSVRVENTTPWNETSLRRDDAMGHSLVAVHTMLAVDGGRFISLLDPPDDAQVAVTACRSEGLYPVLIGEEDLVLASPIILYDHPEVAPQSPGDLYDSLEIDEILALRVMTLTDGEKSEARGTDPRAAAIIDRCDDMSAETLSRLHGQMKAVDPLVTGPEFDDHHGPLTGPVVGPGGRRGGRSVDRHFGPVRRGGDKRDAGSSPAVTALGRPGHVPRRADRHSGRHLRGRRRRRARGRDPGGRSRQR